ncbi:MAG: VOC family protein [Betaproteobacteria bacterium]|nr:VOC family protein [Betaproteobacteria bacterium]
MKHILGVDHVAWLIRDLDQSLKQFARLGFTPSPRQFHSANMGSANHTLVLEDSYVEFIGFTQPTKFNEPWRKKVAEREGLHIVSARTDNVAMALQELREAGVPASDVVPHSRPATLPDGSTVTVAFEVVYVDEGASAPIHVSVCQHRNPEYIFIDALARHPNTALSLSAVHVVADDAAMAARRCAVLFGAEPVRRDDGFAVDTARMRIEFVERSHLAGRDWDLQALPAVSAPMGASFDVASLASAAGVLRTNGVRFRDDGARLLVAPLEGVGAFIEFRVRQNA